jgi:feruloyl-CoA synthase
MAKPPFKPLNMAPPEVETRRLPQGGLVLRSRQDLAPYPRNLSELLRYWADAAPARIMLAERTTDGGWRRISYREVYDATGRVAEALLHRGLDGTRPVVILSDNGIDFGLLALGAMHVGIPVVPVSPAYSLVSKDHAQLKHVIELTSPGLVYAANGRKFAAALRAAIPESVELVVGADPPGERNTTAFSELLSRPPGEAVARAHAEVGPDTISKILFTSGSTGKPKGVINTQRMLCSNQQGAAQVWRFLEERPPVMVDWLPWNHTFGGNFNFDMILRNGGTLYIDGGKPVPGLIETTVRNLREVPSTIHFNVPRAYDMLIPYFERDGELRSNFFRDLDLILYAAAALPPHLWDRLERLSIEATGRRVPMLSAWGSTETAPCATKVHFIIERPGVIGLPIPGTEIKLAPLGGKLELRVKGPNVTPGYYKRPELARAMFDEDGFLRMGDAGRLLDPDDPSQGILFDGRIAENFKLMSGAWVIVGELRTEVISAASPVIQDAVLTGHDREEIGLLIFPNPAGCRSLCPDAAHDTPLEALIGRPEVRARVAEGLAAHNRANPASSRRIARAVLMAELPSIDAGEITDKGYINQRAVLERRNALVARLHAETEDADIIRLDAFAERVAS